MQTPEGFISAATLAAIKGCTASAIHMRIRRGKLVPDATTTSGGALFRAERVAEISINPRKRKTS